MVQSPFTGVAVYGRVSGYAMVSEMDYLFSREHTRGFWSINISFDPQLLIKIYNSLKHLSISFSDYLFALVLTQYYHFT